MDAIDRMFQVLVRTIRARHPGYLGRPFSVSELHQHILPYRHFRRELALETNQEYELTLMQLLSGARGYLEVDQRMRDELSKELTSANPEPSRVRDFGDAEVLVNAQALDATEESASSGAEQGVTTPRSTERAASPASGARVVSQADDAERGGGSRCRFCGQALPRGREVSFCPHCGQNLKLLNCAACGAEIEAGWKFCVACGKATKP